MSAFERFSRERLMRMATEPIDFGDEPCRGVGEPEEPSEPPFGEEQSIVDYLERPVYDEDDLYDGRMDLGYDDGE